MKTFLMPLLFLPVISLGQEDFGFPIYFEDAAGHKDTVFFGYDSSATDSIDAGFGEVDISHLPWKNTALDVRLAGRRTWQGSGQNYKYPFQTKKMITGPLCDRAAPVFTVKILTRHWPVTASWDSTLFQGACRSVATFSSIITDALGDSRRVVNGVKGGFLGFIKFGNVSRITFTEQRYGRYEYFYEINVDPARLDTVNLFWISLSREAFDGYILSLSGSGNKGALRSAFAVVGNQLLLRDLGAEVSEVRVFSPAGKRLAARISDRRVDVSSLQAGIYLVTYADGGERRQRMIFKQ